MRWVVVSIMTTMLLIPGARPAAAEKAPAGSSAASFESYEIYTQTQAGSGSAFIPGEETNRIVGAGIALNKPGTQVFTVAAAFQRGTAAGFAYGATVGRNGAGGAGIAPEPPPGEASGLYPAQPNEMTWEGPVTTAAGGAVVDGRAYAKATEIPTGIAEFQFQHIEVPGQFTIDGGSVRSRGEPVATGVEAEALGVLEHITIGPLQIEEMISRAYGLVPVDSKNAKGDGYTRITGATVNGTPVRISSRGVEVADQALGAEAKEQLSDQVREALKGAGFEDIKLVDSEVKASANKVKVLAAPLKVRYVSDQLATATQGLSGGGFELGGATIDLSGVRATGESTNDAGSDASGGYGYGDGGYGVPAHSPPDTVKALGPAYGTADEPVTAATMQPAAVMIDSARASTVSAKAEDRHSRTLLLPSAGAVPWLVLRTRRHIQRDHQTS